MTYILGLNAYHGDSSTCVVNDGALVAAAEEERFRRIKHWAGFPSEAIRYCLSDAGIRPDDVDVVAINQDAGANLWKKLAYMSVRALDPAHEDGCTGAGGVGGGAGVNRFIASKLVPTEAGLSRVPQGDFSLKGDRDLRGTSSLVQKLAV